MATECTTQQLCFEGLGRRQIVADFDGGDISSDAGGLLLRQTERRTKILERFAECFLDFRNPTFIEHSMRDLVSQRVLAIALGYEDVHDHDDLRHDPLLAALVGKVDPKGETRRSKRDRGKALAGKSTLNRLELGTPDEAAGHRYKKILLDPGAVDDLLVDVFLESYEKPPAWIEIDVDATDDPLHGKQEGRFFHGYYRCYCYLPLYVFCGDHLLGARLGTSDIAPYKSTVEELQRIVGRIRAAWPEVEILIRGDSGFSDESVMAWCEAHELWYLLGLKRNTRLEAILAGDLERARQQYEKTEEASRVFADFDYRTLDSWSRSRRVLGKAEYLSGGPNPRFVVTNLPNAEFTAQEIYEQLYCMRSEVENRIKEQQLYMFADRTSTATMRANQIRLYFSSIAYTLVNALRRLGLAGTTMARAQCHTIRTKLLKIGARIRVTARRVWVSLSSSYPYRALFSEVHRRLAAAPT